jgi:hypothetical protein
MTTTIILILIYVALVFIGYGMLVQSDKEIKNNFICAALIVWAIVPFLILITLGKCIYSLNNKLNNEQ